MDLAAHVVATAVVAVGLVVFRQGPVGDDTH
jgi:hypothetical protein